MLSEDKISHLSHIILKVVMKSSLVQVLVDERRVLKEIKQTFISELAQEEKIDQKVKMKLVSYARGIVEGSAEWDVLYRKTFDEEMRKQVKG